MTRYVANNMPRKEDPLSGQTILYRNKGEQQAKLRGARIRSASGSVLYVGSGRGVACQPWAYLKSAPREDGVIVYIMEQHTYNELI